MFVHEGQKLFHVPVGKGTFDLIGEVRGVEMVRGGFRGEDRIIRCIFLSCMVSWRCWG